MIVLSEASTSFGEALGEAIGDIILALFAIIVGFIAVIAITVIINIVCIILIIVRKRKGLSIEGAVITLIVSSVVQIALILLLIFAA